MPFLGADVAATYDAARVVITHSLQATTYRRGCKMAQMRFWRRLTNEYYDEELDWETCRDVGIYTHPVRCGYAQSTHPS